jgi:hypothetical protein
MTVCAHALMASGATLKFHAVNGTVRPDFVRRTDNASTGIGNAADMVTKQRDGDEIRKRIEGGMAKRESINAFYFCRITIFAGF